ncbi:hypothetical protein AN189_02945 [Loktanella sp. 3ANDIMAR09]|nr:hypothetical protein AN189_02945 [Loktanella sp. 3ANDIMAR09]
MWLMSIISRLPLGRVGWPMLICLLFLVIFWLGFGLGGARCEHDRLAAEIEDRRQARLELDRIIGVARNARNEADRAAAQDAATLDQDKSDAETYKSDLSPDRCIASGDDADRLRSLGR